MSSVCNTRARALSPTQVCTFPTGSEVPGDTSRPCWFLGRLHSGPQGSSEPMEFCSSSLAPVHASRSWSWRGTETQHSVSHPSLQRPPEQRVCPLHGSLQAAELRKVISPASLRRADLVVSPAESSWFPGESSQPGSKHLLPGFRGASNTFFRFGGVSSAEAPQSVALRARLHPAILRSFADPGTAHVHSSKEQNGVRPRFVS